jgi:CO/xanthine dehydrogenase Mo-binding subunit
MHDPDPWTADAVLHHSGFRSSRQTDHDHRTHRSHAGGQKNPTRLARTRRIGFGSFIAQVVQVTVDKEGAVNPTHVWCVVDCGIQVNPDTIRAQMQSGIVFGLSAALYGEITIKDGRVEQTNFGDYRVLRINEVPQIEVHLVKSSEAPGGIGEPDTSWNGSLRTHVSPPAAVGLGTNW